MEEGGTKGGGAQLSVSVRASVCVCLYMCVSRKTRLQQHKTTKNIHQAVTTLISFTHTHTHTHARAGTVKLPTKKEGLRLPKEQQQWQRQRQRSSRAREARIQFSVYKRQELQQGGVKGEGQAHTTIDAHCERESGEFPN